MAKRNNKVVVILALAVVAGAVVVYQQQEKKAEPTFTPRKLLGAVDIEAVAGVKISDAASSLTLRKLSSEQWVLSDRNDYPADGEKLRALALGTLNLEAAEKLTSNPERYAQLGVGEKPSDARVELLDAAGKRLAVLYLGRPREGKPDPEMGWAPPLGQFVRANSDPAVYVSRESLRVEKEPAQWLQREIIQVRTDDLQAVETDLATTQGLTLARKGAEAFTLQNAIPSNFEPKTAMFGGMTGALSKLTLTDVITSGSQAAATLKFNDKYRAIAKNGLVYEVRAARRGEKYYVHLSAGYDAARDFALRDEKTSDTQLAKAMPPARDVLKTINERHGRWIYEIPKYTCENLTRKLSEVIEPKGRKAEATRPKTLPAGAARPSLPAKPSVPKKK